MEQIQGACSHLALGIRKVTDCWRLAQAQLLTRGLGDSKTMAGLAALEEWGDMDAAPRYKVRLHDHVKIPFMKSARAKMKTAGVDIYPVGSVRTTKRPTNIVTLIPLRVHIL